MLLGSPEVGPLRGVPNGANVPARDAEGQRALTASERKSQLQWQLRAAEARRQAELFDAEALQIDLDTGDDVSMALGHCYGAAARYLVVIERLQRELASFPREG